MKARKAILTALINIDSSTALEIDSSTTLNIDSSAPHQLTGLLRQFTPVDDWLAALGIEST